MSNIVKVKVKEDIYSSINNSNSLTKDKEYILKKEGNNFRGVNDGGDIVWYSEHFVSENFEILEEQKPKKDILVDISSLKDSQVGAWEYTYYILFPESHPTYRYTIRATREGFGAMSKVWKQAGYNVVIENEYPK